MATHPPKNNGVMRNNASPPPTTTTTHALQISLAIFVFLLFAIGTNILLLLFNHDSYIATVLSLSSSSSWQQHSSTHSLKTGLVTTAAAAAASYLSMLSASATARAIAVSTTTLTPRRLNPSILWHLVIAPSLIGGESVSEELHDLDYDEDHGYHEVRVVQDDGGGDGGGDGKDDNLLMHDHSQCNHPHEHVPSDDKYAKQNGEPNKNVVDRFSHVIADEIVRRFPFLQRGFQFHPPWIKQKQQSHPQLDSLSISHNKGSSTTHVIDVQNERRVGAWCPADDSQAESTTARSDAEVGINVIDKSVVPCSDSSNSRKSSSDNSCHAKDDGDDDGIERNNVIDDAVQPGMVVYVFPQGEFKAANQKEHTSSDTSLERIDNDDGDVSGDAEGNPNDGDSGGSILGTRCLLDMGQRYDEEEQVVQYVLLNNQVPVELGNVNVHRNDFAYQPVALTIDVGRHGHEMEATGITPAEGVIRRQLPLPSQQQLPWNDRSDDQQVSFRWSGWSWFSQLFISHDTDSYHDDDKGIVNPDDAVLSDSLGHHPYQYRNSQQQSSCHSNTLYEEDGNRPFAGGSHGEIWRARRKCPINARREEGHTGDYSNNSQSFSSCDDGKDLIVKRLKVENGYAVLEAGLREVYFGELLAREVESSSLFTTYVDHFFREGCAKGGQIELWIVFANAGPSLRSFLYTPITATGGFVVFQNSAFWRRLRRSVAAGDDDAAFLAPDSRTHKSDRNQRRGRQEGNARDSEGRALLKTVLKQLITAAAFLHKRGIVHRDIKPSNIMCKTTPPTEDGVIPPDLARCILGDFSSAWDDFSNRNLYSPSGPSSKEQTDEYAPPEVLFQGPSWSPFFHKSPFSYDSWSIGVVALEILLGTPNVFSVDQRTTALLTNRLKKEGATSHDIQRALYLAALSQFCIYVPTESENWPLRRGDPLYDANVVKSKCTLQDFHSALRARDPLGIGFDEDSNTLLHLVWRLLSWNPGERLTASQALKHPFFSKNKDWNPSFLHTTLFMDQVVVHGPHNALEHQTLDPRVDIASDTFISEFTCPKCGKTFADHNSCQRHARSRRHASFCTYDHSSLPQCLNAHSMLPTHPTSGYCDIQGRRKTIEDFHTVHLNSTHQFYGVFDGHLGNLASKYAASSFYHEIKECLSNVDNNILSSQSNWKEVATSKLIQSFQELHNGIIDAVTSSPGGVMDESGTTATILYVTELAVIIANVGDSRAIMSQWSTDAKGNDRMKAMELTVDHVASSAKERMQILERGGFVSEAGGIDRVNGRLAVSRSLGDIKLAPYLSRTPNVFALTKEEAYEECGKVQSAAEQSLPCFIILASDGLWDVMSNQEVVDLAWQVILASDRRNEGGIAFQEAAEALTQEAYVRGSSDNIGVCVVAIK